MTVKNKQGVSRCKQRGGSDMKIYIFRVPFPRKIYKIRTLFDKKPNEILKSKLQKYQKIYKSLQNCTQSQSCCHKLKIFKALSR